jgi:glycine/D-amino acid oxidase-like deaminating enzyme
VSSPQKVAILGGGPAGLACAFELTEPEVAARYDVTIWSLGCGPVATSRALTSVSRLDSGVPVGLRCPGWTPVARLAVFRRWRLSA